MAVRLVDEHDPNTMRTALEDVAVIQGVIRNGELTGAEGRATIELHGFESRAFVLVALPWGQTEDAAEDQLLAALTAASEAYNGENLA